MITNMCPDHNNRSLIIWNIETDQRSTTNNLTFDFKCLRKIPRIASVCSHRYLRVHLMGLDSHRWHCFLDRQQHTPHTVLHRQNRLPRNEHLSATASCSAQCCSHRTQNDRSDLLRSWVELRWCCIVYSAIVMNSKERLGMYPRGHVFPIDHRNRSQVHNAIRDRYSHSSQRPLGPP